MTNSYVKSAQEWRKMERTRTIKNKGIKGQLKETGEYIMYQMTTLVIMMVAIHLYSYVANLDIELWLKYFAFIAIWSTSVFWMCKLLVSIPLRRNKVAT